jgi:probable HAF family extracellular repeat protein
MKRITLLSIGAAVLAGALACGVEPPSSPLAADAAPRLAAAPHTAVRGIIDAGTFGWQHGFGLEINDPGDIAGRTDLGPPNAPTATHAVFWSARTGPIDLGTLGGVSSETRALNNHGVLAGFAQKAGDTFFQRHPTVWTLRAGAVETTELGPFAHGQAEDVNDRGEVVGWSAASPAPTSPPTAFRWTARGGIVPLPPLGGPRSMAAGINGAGDVVGSSTVAPPFVDHAVVWWRDGSVTDIGTMGGPTSARSINDLGEVAGFGQPCPGCQPHAMYWSAAAGIVDLGTFGGVRSFAFEIDNLGRVTGFYETPGGIRHAFVWTRAGGKVDLPTLGGADSSTGSINARGQVTGRAADPSGVSHAVIWQLGPARP